MKHLTEVQRYAISVMWQNEFSKAKIASAIGVHKSTISRELQRNKDEKSGIYDWATAYSLQSHTILGKGEPTRIPMACTGSTFQEELIFQTLDKDILPTARLMLNTRPRKRLNFLSPIQEIYRIFASDFKLINIVHKVAFVT